MFSWFRRNREDWRLVKSFDVEITQTFTHKDGKLYFHLFESNLGNRRVEFACSIDMENEALAKNARRVEFYQTRIYRWEQGRYDPEIPRYTEVPEEETINALKGKV